MESEIRQISKKYTLNFSQNLALISMAVSEKTSFVDDYDNDQQMMDAHAMAVALLIYTVKQS